MAGTLDLIADGIELAGWVPVRVRWNGAEPFIDWCYGGDVRFTEPFFDNSIEKLLNRPYNLAFRRLTSMDALRRCAEANEAAEPKGFIFHMSRCGSTLAARALASSEENIVLSEASPLDWMIRAEVRRPGITRSEQVDWVRWMVMSLGQRRWDGAKNLFIKFDSWHTLYFDLIKEAYPEVPWMFLFRDPVEVLVSLERQPGGAVIPFAIEHTRGELNLDRMIRCEQGEYPAVVLREICLAALNEKDARGGLFVDYERMPGFIWNEMLAHFDIEASESDVERLKEASSFDAKSPSQKFSTDKEKKQSMAGPGIREFSRKHLSEIYEQLQGVSRRQFKKLDGTSQC